MEYEQLRELVKPEYFFLALKSLLLNKNCEVKIPKFDGSTLADTLWPQDESENKDEIGEALIELLCTDKLLTLPGDENYKDALVITDKGEKVIKYLFEAIEYACSKGGIEVDRIAQVSKPYSYYLSDFFERSIDMNWSTFDSGKKVIYALSEELCIAYYNVFGDVKLILKSEED